MKTLLAFWALIFSLCGCGDDPYAVPARHQPKTVMGREYWPLFFSFYFTDRNYLKQQNFKPDWMNVPEMNDLDMFRDCALVQRGDVRAPAPETGKATYRTLKEYYATNGRWEQLENDPKPDKPMILSVSGKRGSTTLAGEIDLDMLDFADWKARHPNFYAFWTAAEWENDMRVVHWGVERLPGYEKRIPDCCRAEIERFVLPWPTNRYQHVAMQRKSLDRKVAIHYGDREHSSAMRAFLAIDHLAAAWGMRLLQLETTNTSRPPQEYRWNIQPMFTRGAARQFGVAWEWYVAQFVNGYRRDGSWMNDSVCNYSWGWPKASDVHPERGISQSLHRRVFYFAYLSGANFIEQEGWYGTFLMKDPATGKATLSPRGRDFRDFHAFTKAHPDRGVPYTPVAILVPFAQGYPAYGGKSWCAYDYTPGDQTVDAVFFTLDPGYDREGETRKGREFNLHNTPYAMMYDVVCPDAPQKPEELLDVLKSYKAVILTGDYPDESFAATLAKYRQAGGRLLRVRADELPPFADGNARVKEIQTGAIAFPKVAEMLRGLQDEYFPFKVTGDVMYGANRTKDGWWLYVFNNRGVTKFPDEFQEIDPKAVAPVAVELGKIQATRVRELLSDRSIPVSGGSFAHTIAPGDLAVFEIDL